MTTPTITPTPPDAIPVPARTFIRVVEVWRPDPAQTLLECAGGLYGSAAGFGAATGSMCFGRGEGLPGQAWEQGRPIVLKRFEGSYFRRTRAAQAEGLTCGIALPIFDGDRLNAVLVIFCGDDEAHAGAIEVWRNEPPSPELTLDDGYYGTTGDAFEYMSRRIAFRKGTGLPGLAWQSGAPVFFPDLGRGGRFLRADGAVKVGINRGFALPCASRGPDQFVLAFLSALATPIVRRFESWVPDDDGASLRRMEGFCEIAGALTRGAEGPVLAAGTGVIAAALAQAVPILTERLAAEPGVCGQAADEAGATSLAAIPVLTQGRVVAVVGWYF